jgi:hypothetical protein
LEGGVDFAVDFALGGWRGELQEGELGDCLGLMGRHLLILMIELITFSIYIFKYSYLANSTEMGVFKLKSQSSAFAVLYFICF